jgi:hypothetical protein
MGESSMNETSDPLYLKRLIESGQSVYGDPATSQAAREALERENARLRLSASLGEIELPAAPDYDREAKEARLHAETGGPVADWEPSVAEFLKTRIEALSALDAPALLRAIEATAADIGNRASATSYQYSRYDAQSQSFPSASAVLDALSADARPALRELVEPARLKEAERLIRGDRALLELLSAKGRRITQYDNRRRELGLK